MTKNLAGEEMRYVPVTDYIALIEDYFAGRLSAADFDVGFWDLRRVDSGLFGGGEGMHSDLAADAICEVCFILENFVGDPDSILSPVEYREDEMRKMMTGALQELHRVAGLDLPAR